MYVFSFQTASEAPYSALRSEYALKYPATNPIKQDTPASQERPRRMKVEEKSKFTKSA